MADTWNLSYAFPNLVQANVPVVSAEFGIVRYEFTHALSIKYSSNLLAGRRLTGNPGLPTDPQIVNGFEGKAAHLAYLCNLFWDVAGGIPPKPILTNFAVGLTRGSITYYTEAD